MLSGGGFHAVCAPLAHLCVCLPPHPPWTPFSLHRSPIVDGASRASRHWHAPVVATALPPPSRVGRRLRPRSTRPQPPPPVAAPAGWRLTCCSSRCCSFSMAAGCRPVRLAHEPPPCCTAAPTVSLSARPARPAPPVPPRLPGRWTAMLNWKATEFETVRPPALLWAEREAAVPLLLGWCARCAHAPLASRVVCARRVLPCATPRCAAPRASAVPRLRARTRHHRRCALTAHPSCNGRMRAQAPRARRLGRRNRRCGRLSRREP